MSAGLESRCRPGEKLTETLGVKMTDKMLCDARAVAASQGLDAPEWVRGLIEDAIERERGRYAALARIFAEAEGVTKGTLGSLGGIEIPAGGGAT